MTATVPRRHIVNDPTLEAGIGIAIVAFGCWITYSAYDGRNRRMPWVVKHFAPWT